jgi:hypothetical protein
LDRSDSNAHLRHLVVFAHVTEQDKVLIVCKDCSPNFDAGEVFIIGEILDAEVCAKLIATGEARPVTLVSKN